MGQMKIEISQGVGKKKNNSKWEDSWLVDCEAQDDQAHWLAAGLWNIKAETGVEAVTAMSLICRQWDTEQEECFQGQEWGAVIGASVPHLVPGVSVLFNAGLNPQPSSASAPLDQSLS